MFKNDFSPSTWRKLRIWNLIFLALAALAFWYFVEREGFVRVGTVARPGLRLFTLLVLVPLFGEGIFRAIVQPLVRRGRPAWSGPAVVIAAGYLFMSHCVATVVDTADGWWALAYVVIWPVHPLLWLYVLLVVVPGAALLGFIYGSVAYGIVRREMGWRSMPEEDPWNS